MNSDRLKINEIFYSIQGESSFAGFPTVFLRTTGCNLRCTYCDTKYSYYEGEWMSLEELIAKVQSYPAKHVCLTGGEPLLQKASLDLMTKLCDLDYQVSLETSGSKSCLPVDSRVRKVIDVKTPDSGAADSFHFGNLQLKDVNTEFKFVICSESDFNWSESFILEHKLQSRGAIFYSPSFGKIDARWLAEEILRAGSPARLQMQLHKYIWSPDLQGV